MSYPQFYITLPFIKATALMKLKHFSVSQERKNLRQIQGKERERERGKEMWMASRKMLFSDYMSFTLKLSERKPVLNTSMTSNSYQANVFSLERNVKKDRFTLTTLGCNKSQQGITQSFLNSSSFVKAKLEFMRKKYCSETKTCNLGTNFPSFLL